MTDAIDIPLGPWMPDSQSFRNPGLVVAKNCYPSSNGYQPFWGGTAGTFVISGATQANPCVITATAHGFSTGASVAISGVVGMTELNGNTYTVTSVDPNSFSLDGVNSSAYNAYASDGIAATSISGTVLGSKRFERTNGTEVIMAGTSSNLYVIVGATAFATAVTISPSNGVSWAFEQFGAAIYATIANDGDDYSLYLTDIDTDTSFSTSPGTPPGGRALARIDDFLVYGNLLPDIDTSFAPYRVRWSAFNNPQYLWGTDIATQQDYVDLPQHLGPVTGIAGGSHGYIMQKFGTSLFDYTGTASAFQRVLLDGSESQSAGCESHNSIVSISGVHYFLSNIGFCKLAGGGIQIISSGKVWDWFLANANTTRLSDVQGTANYDRRCVVWNFFKFDTTAYNAQIIYNWETDSWSYAFVTVDWLVNTLYTGTFGEGDPRKRNILGGFVGGTWTEYSGTPIEAILETGEFQMIPGKRSYLQEVAVIVENENQSSTKVAVKYRDNPGVTKTSTTSTVEHALGFTPVNVDGRYFGIEVTIPAAASWAKASSLQLRAIPSGET